MNSVVLIGRLTNKPELSYTANTQTACGRFTLAVDRPRRDGEDQGADFIRITVWGRQAETCERYLDKGRQVAVHGRIQTGSYTNREGQKVYTTDVVADRVEFLGGSQGENFASNGRNDAPPRNTASEKKEMSQTGLDSYDDWTPFNASDDDFPI